MNSYAIEEGIIIFIVDYALKINANFAGMVIAPHARFTIWNFTSFWGVVPAIWAMVDGMEVTAVL